jgi:hypothetical protein
MNSALDLYIFLMQYPLLVCLAVGLTSVIMAVKS